jgi:hypothetical protein
MNAARSTPVLDLLAANDNAVDDDGVLTSDPRARTALSSPLTHREAIPPAACRRHHDVSGERLFSSIVCVEQFDGAPRWRVSVTLWGRPTNERRDLAMMLARQVLSGLGTGAFTVEQRASVTLVRRALSPRERAVLARSRLAVAIQP